MLRFYSLAFCRLLNPWVFRLQFTHSYGELLDSSGFSLSTMANTVVVMSLLLLLSIYVALSSSETTADYGFDYGGDDDCSGYFGGSGGEVGGDDSYSSLCSIFYGEPATFSNKEDVVSWSEKKTGLSRVYNITSTDEAEEILSSYVEVVFAFLNSLTVHSPSFVLQGPESNELAAASRLEDDLSFYQTVEPNVAKLFEIDAEAKRPALVLLKKDVEKCNHFDGKFEKSAISDFVFANKFPLVTTFSRKSASLIFESQIKKQILLFATSNDSEKVLPTFQEAAKSFKGKLFFVYVQLDNEDTDKPLAKFFGITGDAPKVIGYSGNYDAKKYILNAEVTLDKVKAFGEDFVEDKLKPFYKSDRIPETNDEDVKVVVGNNFDEIVLDKSKDVLLEIYAPRCGHCQSLEPTYNKLAKNLRGINSIVIAKMDGTTNEHPRAKAYRFPTILFFPAGNKSCDPITVDTERTVVAFYTFLKKHAAIPFKKK